MQCKFNGFEFTSDQYNQITAGKKAMLSEKKIALYANPVFDKYQMAEIRIGLQGGLTIEQASIYAVLNSDNQPVYNDIQMSYIREGLESKLTKEQLDMYMSLDSLGKPIFNSSQMKEICLGFEGGLNREQVSKYTALNSYNKPIFDGRQMGVIKRALISEVKEGAFSILTALNVDCEPIFNNAQMSAMLDFIKEANTKQMQQLEESIEAGLSFEQFSPYINYEIPVEKMRVFRSLVENGCDPKDIVVLREARLSHNELKDIKYLMQFEKLFDIKVLPTDVSEINVDDVTTALVKKICIKANIKDLDSKDIIDRCILYKLPPEQIKFIANKDLATEQMKQLAIGLLNGISINELSPLINSVSSSNIKENVEEIIKNRICRASILDENESVPFSDWFDDIEK